MSRQTMVYPEAAPLDGFARLHNEELEARLEWLCSEVQLGVNDLRATFPFSKMKFAKAEDLRYYKKVVKPLSVNDKCIITYLFNP